MLTCVYWSHHCTPATADMREGIQIWSLHAIYTGGCPVTVSENAHSSRVKHYESVSRTWIFSVRFSLKFSFSLGVYTHAQETEPQPSLIYPTPCRVYLKQVSGSHTWGGFGLDVSHKARPGTSYFKVQELPAWVSSFGLRTQATHALHREQDDTVKDVWVPGG